jgi:spermidine/putrescine transport system permease protein
MAERRRTSPWLRVLSALVYAFLYLPLVVLVVLSFNDARRSVVSWQGFSTRWYGEMLHDDAILAAVGTTLLIAASVTLIAVVLGTLLALGLERFTRSSLLDGGVYFPILVPDIVTGIALLSFYSLIHFSLGIRSIVIAHSVWGIAFATAIVRTRLRGFDRSIEEASLDLGVKEIPTFFKVTLPVIWPGVLAAALVVFTLSVDEFVIAYFTAGRTVTFPIQVYSMIRFGVTPEINAVATVMLTFSMLLIVVALFVSRPRAGRVPTEDEIETEIEIEEERVPV